MKKVIASAGLLALGAAGVHNVQAFDLEAGDSKPWSISGTFRGFYDDNFATQPSGPNRKGSFGLQVSPSLSLKTAPAQTTVSASYVYSLLYFGDRQGNHFDQTHDFELFVNHNFDANYSITFNDGFVIAQDPELLSATTAIALPLRANGDNIRNAANIIFNGQLTPLFGAMLGYNNAFYDFQQNYGNEPDSLKGVAPSYSALLDRIEQTVTVEAHWTPEAETTGILGYQFGAVNYLSSESISPSLFLPPGPGYPTPASPLDYVNPNSRNNYSHTAYLGASHNFRSDLSAAVRAGVQYVDYYNAPAGNPGHSLGPYASLTLNYTYTQDGAFSLGFSHARSQNDLPAAGSALITEDSDTSVVYGTITQILKPISPNLTASLNAQYQNSQIHGGPFSDKTEQYVLLGLDFSYRFNQFLSADVGYNYDLLSSQIPARGYDRNRVFLGLTATY